MTDPNHIALVVAAVIAVAIAVHVGLTVTSAEFGQYMNESAEWCEDRDGDLYNERALWHGGLHCELPNGTHVHMSDVVEVSG